MAMIKAKLMAMAKVIAMANGQGHPINSDPTRRDNNKGNIIVLFNTSRACQDFFDVNDIFMSISDAFVWIGIPKANLRRPFVTYSVRYVTYCFG